MPKTLKSTCERVYFLVKLNLYTEGLLKTFEIEEQLFSRNPFEIAASDNDQSEIMNTKNIHRKTPLLESLFIKAAGLNARNFVKKRHRHRGFPVKSPKFLRGPFLNNTPGGCF